MNKTKLLKMTTSYHDDLIQSLQEPKEAYAYLQVAIEEYQQDGDAEFLLVALRNVAEAQGGLTELSKKTDLNRQSLYKSLSKKGNPRLDTLGSVLKGLGYQLSIQPLS